MEGPAPPVLGSDSSVFVHPLPEAGVHPGEPGSHQPAYPMVKAGQREAPTGVGGSGTATHVTRRPAKRRLMAAAYRSAAGASATWSAIG